MQWRRISCGICWTNEFEGGREGAVSTIEVKASYVEIFLDSAYDMKAKFEPVITHDKGDDA